MKTISKLLLCSLMVLTIITTSCSKKEEGGKTEDEIKSYTATQSPGDIWEFDLNHTTMTWTGTWDHGTEMDPSDDLAFSGEFSMLPSGFLKMVLLTTTPADPAYPSGGSGFFYASEAPGMSIFAQPAGSLSGNIINGIDRSTCSDIAGTYNFVHIPPAAGYNALTDRAYGTMEISGTSGGYTFSGWEKSLDCLPVGGACTTDGAFSIPGSGICMDGTIDITDAGAFVGKLQTTPSNVFMIDFGAGNGGIYGGLQSTVALSDLAGKKFTGFMDVPSTGEQRAVSAEFDASGVAHFFLYNNLETNELDTLNLVDGQINSTTDGLLLGKFDNQSGIVSHIAGAITIHGSQIVIAIISFQDADDPSDYPALSAVVGYTP